MKISCAKCGNLFWSPKRQFQYCETCRPIEEKKERLYYLADGSEAFVDIGWLIRTLEPFALAADRAQESSDKSKALGMGEHSNDASPGWGIRFGHLKDARAAVEQLRALIHV